MTDQGLILVTGATGFVGKWTILELLRKGYRVRGTVRSLSRAAEVTDTLSRELGQEPLSNLELVEADLLDDKGWTEAMAGVSTVQHIATVIRADEPKDQDLVIRPALEGTQRVFRFADAAGIKRIIMTSSIATVGYGHGQTSGRRVYDETYFTNLGNMKWTWAYCVGKTRAEQFAWAFAKEHGIELTTIHPGAIIGPALDEHASISLGMVTGLLAGKVPAMPSNGFSIIDVRDVAALHVEALENRETVGQRYLATAEYTPFPKVADIVREAYPDWDVTTKQVPDWIIKVIASFGGPARQIINDIGNEKVFDGAKSEKLLGRKFIGAKEAVLATAESVIRLGLVQKKPAKA
jgi:nucleoside-diphosphate-sugar epimerase